MPLRNLNQSDWQEDDMFLQLVSERGLKISIIARRKTRHRLSGTCFRGTDVAMAGNFRYWNSIDEMLSDRLVRSEFLAELSTMWGEEDLGTHSVEIIHTRFVGYESTDPRSFYDDTELEKFEPNRRSEALRIKKTCVHRLAPMTRTLTIVFEFKSENGMPVAIIHSVYPGADIGELAGNVTERTGRVFFDWEHPGLSTKPS